MKKHHLSLVVLAGGLGTRFGGNKQIAEIAGLGCTIMELSIADAVAAGVTHYALKIMFITPRSSSQPMIIMARRHFYYSLNILKT